MKSLSGTRPVRPRAALAALAAAQFAVVLATSVVNVALPRIQSAWGSRTARPPGS
ncbi:hypothetical protein AB0L14_25955 [Streptomyces sp. NPDC052727]|uniref:hypothetical protein n=1 Tax=Streptomyces sp. NPDC052727 TaxID=3154854 RepID=UPI00342FE9FC